MRRKKVNNNLNFEQSVIIVLNFKLLLTFFRHISR
jgi:hypothetical protein